MVLFSPNLEGYLTNLLVSTLPVSLIMLPPQGGGGEVGHVLAHAPTPAHFQTIKSHYEGDGTLGVLQTS